MSLLGSRLPELNPAAASSSGRRFVKPRLDGGAFCVWPQRPRAFAPRPHPRRPDRQGRLRSPSRSPGSPQGLDPALRPPTAPSERGVWVQKLPDLSFTARGSGPARRAARSHRINTTSTPSFLQRRRSFRVVGWLFHRVRTIKVPKERAERGRETAGLAVATVARALVHDHLGGLDQPGTPAAVAADDATRCAATTMRTSPKRTAASAGYDNGRPHSRSAPRGRSTRSTPQRRRSGHILAGAQDLFEARRTAGKPCTEADTARSLQDERGPVRGPVARRRSITRSGGRNPM